MKTSPKWRQTLQLYFWTLSFTKDHIVKVVGFILCGLIVALAQMGIFKVVQNFIDQALNKRQTGSYVNWLVLVLGVVLVMYGATAVKNWLERIIRENAIQNLQKAVLQKLQTLGVPFYERNAVGETLGMLNTDILALQEIYKTHFPNLVSNSLMMLAAFGFLLSMNAKLTLLTFPFFFVYYFLSPVLDKKAVQWGEKKVKAQGEWNAKIYDTLSGLTEYRAYHRQAWDTDRSMAKLHNLNKSWLTMVLFGSLRGFVRRCSMYLGIFVLYILSARLYQAGQFTVGDFVSFFFYYFYLTSSSTNVIVAALEQRVLLIHAEKINRFMQLTPEVQEASDPLPTALRGNVTFDHVHFQYPTGEPILEDFCLDVQAGERVAFVGKSGAGKSTLLKLIARFYDPLQGQILMEHTNVKQVALADVRESIGYVFQETYLFGKSVYENIRFGNPSASQEQVISAAKAANAHEFIMELPEKYDTLVGERGVKLSGGQRQRLSIARMLLKDPTIVLLDEATSALDHATESSIKAEMDRVLRGKTIFAVAHRLSTIQDFDKIVLVDQGRAVEVGTFTELMKRKGLFYRLVTGGDNEFLEMDLELS